MLDTLRIERFGRFTLDNAPEQITRTRTTGLHEVELITFADGCSYCNDREYPLATDRLVYYPIGARRKTKGRFTCWYVHFSCTDSFLSAALPKIRKSVRVDSAECTAAFKQIIDGMVENSDCGRLLASAMLLKCVTALIDTGARSVLPLDIKSEIQKAQLFLDTNFLYPIVWTAAADHIGYSHTYFHTVFKKHYGCTPHDYIVNLRLNEAKKRLIMTNQRVAQIAEDCAFGNYTYFSYLFKNKLGVSPLTYRKQHTLS